MRLPAPPPTWATRLLHWWQRRRYGSVLQPTLLWSYRPRLMYRFMSMFAALRRRDSPLPAMLRGLVAVRVSQLNDCSFCVDMNGALLAQAGADDALLQAVATWRDGAAFTDAQRAALDYAEALTRTPPAVGDEIFARLRAHYTPEAIVELTALAAFQNMSARFNAALQAQAHGFCSLPAGAPAAAASAPARAPDAGPRHG